MYQPGTKVRLLVAASSFYGHDLYPEGTVGAVALSSEVISFVVIKKKTVMVLTSSLEPL